MGMEGTGEDTEVTIPDPMDMVTMERDLLMKLPLPSLAPTPTLKLTPGTGTMGMLTGLTDMVITVADMEAMEAITTERDLLMKLPLPSLDPTPMPRLTPGTGTMGMLLMAMPTGDKKWTSTTSNNIRSFPADSSLKRQFLQNNFLFTLLKNSFV